jgi:hypothetical protein
MSENVIASQRRSVVTDSMVVMPRSALDVAGAQGTPSIYRPPSTSRRGFLAAIWAGTLETPLAATNEKETLIERA